MGVVVVLVRDGVELGTWPLELGDRLDLGLLDRVARMQLCACRVGAAVRIRGAAPDLAGLLRLVGLAELVEVGREPEDGEEADVHEVVVPNDAPV